MSTTYALNIRHRLRRWSRSTISVLAAVLVMLAPCRPWSQPQWKPDIDPKYGSPCISEGCHSVEIGGTTLKHVPYLEGNCLSCHVGHDSDAPMLLKADMQASCLACHDRLEMTENRGLQHPPLAAACTDCHDPHESLLRNRLRDEERFLSCSECHEDFLEASHALPHRHDFFDPVTDCGSCHYAHQNSDNLYLRENVSETCLTCHDMSIQVEGRKLENVGRRLRESRVVHGALEGPACPDCHTPHGALQPALLTNDYPASEYASYSPENYALCWKCHDSGLTESETGVGVTGFRDGDRNLHRLHVAELKRGRACHICHTAHAGDRDYLLRERIRFKNWVSRFEFASTPSGGSCETACHRPKEYSR